LISNNFNSIWISWYRSII